MRRAVAFIGQVVERQIDLILVVSAEFGVNRQVQRGPARRARLFRTGIVFGAGGCADKEVGSDVCR